MQIHPDALDRARGRGATLLLLALATASRPSAPRIGAVEERGADAPWRAYELYAPTVERRDVIDGHLHPHRYNHCSAIAWFDGAWHCFWGSNTHPDEHAPGQRLAYSVSRDAREWSPAAPLFSEGALCENPVRYPDGKGHQWQPNVGVVGEELWVLWNQGGSASDFRGGAEDTRGLYLSRRRAGGKWVNRRLLWDGRPTATIDGREFQVVTTQNLCRLRSGRVLAPVTFYSRGRAADAPPEVADWWACEKRNGVIHTDDRGATWHLSRGCILPGASWVQWEPTVWEQSDGSILMFARNNRNPGLGHRPIPSHEYLLWSISRDGGATWAPHRTVPLETVCSRMHVAPADGRGAWDDARSADDFGGRRQLMIHNDAPGALLPWAAGRRNLALFFKRGDGIDFVAGTGVSGDEEEVAYPQMWEHDGTLAISYTRGNCSPRSIRVATVRPLPDPAKYYLLPRSNGIAPSPRPHDMGRFWSFTGHQRIASRQPVDSGEEGFSLGAWIQVRGGGALFDTRRDRPPSGGFSVMIGPPPGSGAAGGRPGAPRPMVPQICLLTEPHVIAPDLPLERYRRWHYLGVSVRRASGEAIFRVDDRVQTMRFDPYPDERARGATAHIGAKRPATSLLSGFNGDIRFLALYPSATLGAEEHAWLHNRFAGELGRAEISSATQREPTSRPALWLDPDARDGFECQFELPAPDTGDGVESVTTDGLPCARVRGEGSMGVDLDENHRERGDRVALRARFRVESGDGVALCTVGDARDPARVIARAGKILLRLGGADVACGGFRPGEWISLEIESGDDTTRARASDGPWAEAKHRPSGTWLYLGEGFPSYTRQEARSFVIDIGSVHTRVSAGDRGG